MTAWSDGQTASQYHSRCGSYGAPCGHLGRYDARPDELGANRRNCITAGRNSVHPVGKPIIHSTSSGWTAPCTRAFSPRAFLSNCAAPPVLLPSRLVGVGHRASRSASGTVTTSPSKEHTRKPSALGESSTPSIAEEDRLGWPNPGSTRTGVPGHQEHARPKVGRSERCRVEYRPLRIEPEAVKVCEDAVESVGHEHGDVFDDDPSGAGFSDDAGELAPEPRLCAIEPCSESLTAGKPSERQVLAGEASAEHVHGRQYSTSTGSTSPVGVVTSRLSPFTPTTVASHVAPNASSSHHGATSGGSVTTIRAPVSQQASIISAAVT